MAKHPLAKLVRNPSAQFLTPADVLDLHVTAAQQVP